MKWLVLYAWLLGVAACTPTAVELGDVAPTATSAAAASPSADTGAVAEALAETTASLQDNIATPTTTMTNLAFTGNGDTFLAAIDQAMVDYGEPLAHRYLTVRAADDYLWQGELLRYADETLLFLQATQRGGETALQLQFPPDILATELDGLALPIVEGDPVDSPYPVVEFVRARLEEENEDADQWRFDVTIRYPDTGWDDYADGWHIETEAGEILGTRILLHPHVAEQPFTRSISGVTVPHGNETIYLRSHDLVSGYHPERFAIPLQEDVHTDQLEVIR